MGIRELKTFVAVAERGSLSAGADARFISLPAVSAQIASLEAEWGISLFDRTRKPARLTNEGLALLAKAREVLVLYDQIGDAVREADDLTGSSYSAPFPLR